MAINNMRLIKHSLCLSSLFYCVIYPAYADISDTLETDIPCSKANINSIPQNAYFLPLKKAKDLQSTLGQYKIIKLNANSDYSKHGGPSSITLSSDQQLYGLPGSKIGRVFISGGSTGITLQGVATNGIEFAESSNAIHGNCFRRVTGRISAKGAKLENNLFIDLNNSQLDFDTSKRGYLKNNQFIRVMVHGTSPALQLRGDPEHQSSNNVFLWSNILTPHGDGIIIDNQRDVSFIGLDAESWNWSKRAKNQAMMTVRSTGSLKIIAANGGDPRHRTGRYFDLDAEEIQILGSRIGPVRKPSIILQPDVKRISLVNVQKLGINNKGPNPFIFNAFAGRKPTTTLNGRTILNTTLTKEQESILKNMFVSPDNSGQLLKRPVFQSIPDPVGPNWNSDLKSKSDSTDFIQGLVDSQGIAHIPAGIYYISKPIRLKDGQGIIGSGAHQTAIIAKNKNIDMIVGVPNAGKRTLTSFSLIDITLQGGRNGIHHDSDGSGSKAVYNRLFISHVTFRDMSEAGIFLDGIIGWDNNFIDNVNFYRCADAGIKQRVSPLWLRGHGPGMTYMDKNVFYNCQFVENGRGIDFNARRANNLNAFVNCSFRDNLELAVNLHNNNSTIFANTEFINNGGNPVIQSNKPTFFVNSYFKADRNNISLLPNNATCEDCTFELGGSSSSSIVPKGSRVFLSNSESINVSLGKPDSGLLLNSKLPENPPFNKQGVFIIKNTPHILIPGLP
jgi:hypothetical protein